MCDILFCFDTEDFTSNEAADAIRNLALLLESEDIRGNFCVVGLLARQLTAWGREDVKAALRSHEIQYHTYGHSLHPMINEYTDKADYLSARREFLLRESEGLVMLREHLGTERVFCAVPPGNSKSYAAMYGYAEWGIPAYCDTVLDDPDGGLYFCNALHMQYLISLESLFYDGSKTIPELLDWLRGRRRAILYTHPNRVLFEEFWDVVNYDKENLVPFGQWKPCRRESPERVAYYYDSFRTLIRAMKADGGFQFRTVGDIVAEEAAAPARAVRRSDCPNLLAALKDGLRPLRNPCPLSVAEVFAAAAAFFLDDKVDCFTPGPAYGFLEEPMGIDKPCVIPTAELWKAVSLVETGTFLPSWLWVGGVRLGPADALIAMLTALSEAVPPAEVHLMPRAQQLDLDRYPQLRDLRLRGTWRHSDAFEDRWLSDRLRLQAWTIRNVNG
ncbi:MAG: hypothetical protein LBJ11_11230 [Oscillospiraceae bacterium]|jgi:hypothetical protein|nr:hypothetical protein [Oscillospiraceae bacterium]